MENGTSSDHLAKLLRVFLKMRRKREELSKAFNEEDAKIKEAQELIKQELLEHCKEHGVTSVKTDEGNFYRSAKTIYWTDDWEELNKFVLEKGVPEFYQKRLSQAVIKEYLEENPTEVPKGLNAKTEYTITVRKK